MASEWISVEERVPEIGTTVLVWKPEGFQNQQYDIVLYSKSADDHRRFTRRDGQWWNNGQRITYWKPLEPPDAR